MNSTEYNEKYAAERIRPLEKTAAPAAIEIWRRYMIDKEMDTITFVSNRGNMRMASFTDWLEQGFDTLMGKALPPAGPALINHLFPLETETL